MSNLTLKHLLEYAEGMHTTKNIKRWNNLVDGHYLEGCSQCPSETSGQGNYGIVEEPCVLNGWMPPLTVLPPRDYSMRRYYGT